MAAINTQAGTTPSGITTIVANEYNAGGSHITVLTLTNFKIGTLAGAGAIAGYGNLIYSFPAGVQLHEVSYFSLSLTAAGTAVTTDTGIGSTAASGALSLLSSSSVFENYITGQSVPTAAGGGAVTVVGPIGATAGILTDISLQTAAKSKNLYLNSAGAWNADNTGDLKATGSIVLKWSTLA